MREIPLTQGKVALVDDSDFEWLNEHKWCASKSPAGIFYAVRRVREGGVSKCVRMHRVILGLPAHRPDVDHEDGNGLNNQRLNIRTASRSQNEANQGPQCNNTSGFKGVYWHSGAGKWMAQIVVNARAIYLRLFNDKISAAQAYNAAAINHFGEFARLNSL